MAKRASKPYGYFYGSSHICPETPVEPEPPEGEFSRYYGPCASPPESAESVKVLQYSDNKATYKLSILDSGANTENMDGIGALR